MLDKYDVKELENMNVEICNENKFGFCLLNDKDL